MTSSTYGTREVALRPELFSSQEELALAGFLAGYSGLTREAYMLDLRQYVTWCAERRVALFGARRADIEAFGRHPGSSRASSSHDLSTALHDRLLLPVCRTRGLHLEVAGDDVLEAVRVCERQGGEIEERVALGRSGPVDDAGDLVTMNEDVGIVQVAVDEHRLPRPKRGLGEATVAHDHVGGKYLIGDKPVALVGQAGCELVDAWPRPWWQRCVVQRPDGGPRCGPCCRRRG
jgi:hypothetical protein